MPEKHFMSSKDASRIQSGQAKGGGDMSSGGFSARAQSAAATNTNAGYGQQSSGGSQGNTGGNAGQGQGRK